MRDDRLKIPVHICRLICIPFCAFLLQSPHPYVTLDEIKKSRQRSQGEIAGQHADYSRSQKSY